MAADVVKLSTAKTVQGQPVKIAVKEGVVRINGAKVLKTDIACSNGVILAITLEDGHLIVRGRQAEEDEGRMFLHRGIAARQFQRSFVLSDRVEVAEARLERGLLQIDLVRRRPQANIQTIRIGGGAERAIEQ